MLSQVIVTLWWLGFWTAVGLCLGSFLNVIIYRLPRDQSLRVPLWSACPECGRRIRWYDNLPIVSFIILRGRCRDCRAPIATRYLFIEATMALVVLMLLDAFFIGHLRAGVSASDFGLTDHLTYDWPIVVAHVILFASLLSMSCVDLEHYWVDVRFINIAAIIGVVLHALWTPKHSAAWPRPSDTTAVMSLFAMGGLGFTWVLLRFLPQAPPDVVADPEPESSRPEEHDELRESPTEPTSSENPQEGAVSQPQWEAPPFPESGEPFETQQSGRPRRQSRVLGWLAVLMLVALFLALVLAESDRESIRFVLRAALPLGLFFIAIVSESTVHRESDQQIFDAIQEERHGARHMVLMELLLLLPAIGLAAVGYWIMRGNAESAGRISEVLHWDTRVWGFSMLRNWAPLVGLATAVSGYVVAGAVGWTVRIVFTLVFGKEAFGTGDIHLIAVAGCVAGWPVAVLGFFVATGLALVGYLLALPFKRARALPLGPWLALAFLIVVLFYDRIIESPWVANLLDTLDVLFLRISQS